MLTFDVPNQEVTLDAALLRETQTAWLVDVGGQELWLLKTQVRMKAVTKKLTMPSMLFFEKIHKLPISIMRQVS
jgi:hypothetical protein